MTTKKTIELKWQCLRFDQLTNFQLYELLKLRTEIFVVEQNCAYLETDGKDYHQNTYHLIGFLHDEIIASARLLPPGLAYNTASIGRVVVATKARKLRLGHELLKKAIQQTQRFWPKEKITIGAQHHLSSFYQQHGFKEISAPYDEDGILHVKMQRAWCEELS